MVHFGERREQDDSKKVSSDQKVQLLEKSLNGLLAWAQQHLAQENSSHPLFREMVSNFSFAVDCLRDPDAGTRLLALRVLDTFCSDMETLNLTAQLEKAAFEDSDAPVRRKAISVLVRLIRCHAATPEKAIIGAKVARVVLDPSVNVEDRLSAYLDLCTLSADYSVRIKSCDEVCFPQEVDWQYVKSWEVGATSGI